jgi:hypothetical protein
MSQTSERRSRTRFGVLGLLLVSIAIAHRSCTQNRLPASQSIVNVDSTESVMRIAETWRDREHDDVRHVLNVLREISDQCRGEGIMRDVKLGVCLDFLSRVNSEWIDDIEPILAVLKSGSQSGNVIDMTRELLNRVTNCAIKLDASTSRSVDVLRFNRQFERNIDEAIEIWRESFAKLSAKDERMPIKPPQ